MHQSRNPMKQRPQHPQGRATRIGLLAAAASAVGAFVGVSTALQPAGGDNPAGGDQAAAVLAMIKSIGEPTEHHGVLNKMAGAWTYDFTFSGVPDADPTVSKGRATYEMQLGGRCLRGETAMDFAMMPGVSLPMSGLSLMTYNQHTRQYQIAWVDTLDPYMVVMTGPMDDAGVIRLKGEMYEAGQSLPMTCVITMTGNDAMTQEFFGVNPATGVEQKVVAIAFTRAPAEAPKPGR